MNDPARMLQVGSRTRSVRGRTAGSSRSGKGSRVAPGAGTTHEEGKHPFRQAAFVVGPSRVQVVSYEG